MTGKPHEYTVGWGLSNPGVGHVNIARSESATDETHTAAVHLIPTGQPLRIDAPDPGSCHLPN
jgi:hypothetical protein